jgi:hypothetical protein
MNLDGSVYREQQMNGPISNLVAVLPVGRPGARTIAELAALAGMTKREAERSLQVLVDAGEIPLVAGDAGVYLTESAAELEDYAKRLQRRIVSQYRRVRGVRKAARTMRAPAVQGVLPWA